MRRGCHPYLNRFAPLLTRTVAATAAEIAHLITGKTPASAAAIFLALVLAGQAQESIQEVALPPWSESTLPSSEPAPFAQAETVPSAPEPLPAAPAEPLPASEEVFPSSSDSWSSLTNYTTAQTTVVPAPAAGGPYGEFSTKNVATGGAASSGEPRRFHYALQLTVRGVWDDNSIIDTTGLWANLDASASTRVNIFNTRMRVQYDLTGKLYLQGEFDSYVYFYPGNISDYTVSGGLYLYYNWLPKVSVGVGGTFGYDWVDEPTPNQAFEQMNARLNYQATAKLGLYASAGAEFRQFDGNRSTYTTPVFEVGVTHHPFDGTTINLAAGRRIYNSGFLGAQDFADTYFVGRFQQRLFRRLYFGLGAGYENSNYFAAAENISASRDDNYWFIEPSLDVLITRWLNRS